MILSISMHMVVFFLVLAHCDYGQSISLKQSGLIHAALPTLVSQLPAAVINITDFHTAYKDEYIIKSDDIEFKYYCPSSFQHLRKLIGCHEEEFRTSMGSGFCEMLSDSKSGQSFFRSSDNTIMVKTIEKEECDMMCQLVEPLIKHIESVNYTCLNTILGLFHVKVGKRVSYILVSKNVFHSKHWDDRMPSLALDLKGSIVGRKKSAASMVLKDCDLVRSGIILDIGSANILLEALQDDVKFLSDFGLMDYSILIFKGVCKTSLMPERGSLVLESLDGSSFFQCGIVDFLQPYNRRKRLESFIKSLYYGKRQASCVAPRLYGNRLVDFIRENLSGKPSIGSEKINH